MREQISVSRSEAIKVKTLWEDKSVHFDFVINIAKVSFTKGDIKMIVIEPYETGKAEYWDKLMKEFYDEEKINHRNLSAKSAEYKASLLDMFSYMFEAAAKKRPSKEALDMAHSVQLGFFTENPRRTICDAHLLKDLIGKLIAESSPHLWDSAVSSYRECYFRLVDKAIFRDMQLSGQLQS